MTIKVGDRLPEGSFKMPGDQGPVDVSVSDYFGGARVALIGVPGAFTPTCHANHLPGFLSHLDELKGKGIDKVACLSVNDVHVLKAWAAATEAAGKIDFLADGNGDYVKALGLESDRSPAGMGLRSTRFSMLVEDGVVKMLNVEGTPGQVGDTSAERFLEQL
ncbi:MAG TPA: redoxin family protein [Hyphomicrobiales bacterium]|nr:redoxin family protein [Hyphomicrobiales bacterium]